MREAIGCQSKSTSWILFTCIAMAIHFFLFPVKIYKYVKREKLPTKMIVAIAGNFPAVSWQQEVVFPWNDDDVCTRPTRSLK